MRSNAKLAVSSRWAALSALAIGVTASSCVGSIGNNDSTSSSEPGGSSDAIGPSPMRRLNKAEYNATVQGLFRIKGSPADAWPADGITSGFDTDVSGQAATADLIEQIMRSAEAVADEALPRLGTLLPCSSAAKVDVEACGKTFIETYAHRAYRRPLTSEDRSRLGKIFSWGVARKDLATGIRLVIMAMLQSPSFLYRPEFGKGGDDGELTDHEIATRLSFFLTSAGPDDKLLGAADAGELHTAAQIKAHAERLLASDGGRRSVDRFFSQWLPLERLANATKGADVYKNFDDATKASMLASTQAFVEHVVFDSKDGGLGELMTANYAFVDGTTAPLYGFTGHYDKLTKVTVKQPRAGVLTQVGVLAGLASSIESAPIQRGKFIYTNVLCQPIGAPPANLKNAGVPPPFDPTRTTRELFEQHTKNPACAGCHSQMDPFGFALENYDAMGRFRKTDNHKPVDASGSLDLNGDKVSFNGAVELGKFLTTEPLARSCFVDKWFTYAFGRDSGASDDETLTDLGTSLPDADTPIRNLLVAITQTRAFAHRTKVAAEECSK